MVIHLFLTRLSSFEPTLSGFLHLQVLQFPVAAAAASLSICWPEPGPLFKNLSFFSPSFPGPDFVALADT